MQLWRCPHCATPQAETGRCWVCRRSSTACGACRHFRRSVAAQVGYCGLDRQRLPLRGDEVRACWEAADSGDVTLEATSRPMGAGSVWAVAVDVDRTTVRSELFIDVAAAAVEGRAWPAPGATEAPRWTLFGETDA